jgi:thiamine-phosphate pyrophosphorylase
MSSPSQVQRTRLYLISPPGALVDTTFQPLLEAALSGGDVAALLLPTPHSGAIDTALAESLIRRAQRQNVAVLIENDLVLVKALNADGVHLTTGAAAVRNARAQLGDSGIVGVYCGLSRHDAMLAGENGADYVAFGADLSKRDVPEIGDQAPPEGGAEDAFFDTISWWSELMEPPVVAWLDASLNDSHGGDDWASLNQSAAVRLARVGVDFLAVGSAVWGHADGPMAAVAALNTLCAGAADEATGRKA